MFWVDLVSVFPWDAIVLAAMGMQGAYVPTRPSGGDTGMPQDPTMTLVPLYVAALKWLTLLRMYRVVELFVKWVVGGMGS